ncbi:helix-turn-helix transcriptional regulator [Streptomyces sp. LE64]|uniref:helix-turn-helix transcriptional regulator n=1 Tax=Streptomyces sp. LE64 TaxID=3448653 RepID=UPI004042810C
MPPVFAHGRLRLYLLKLLDEAPRHGYEVIRLLEERFRGLYAPSAGTVYPRLAKLEAEGLVTHATEGGRKVYSITEAGRAELAARSGELADLEVEIRASVAELAAEIRNDVRAAAHDVRRDLRTAARRMNPSADEPDGHGTTAPSDPLAGVLGDPEAWRRAKEDFTRAKQGWKDQARRARDESRRAREEAQHARRLAKEAQARAQEQVQRIVERVQDQVRSHVPPDDWPTGVPEALSELMEEFSRFGTPDAPPADRAHRADRSGADGPPAGRAGAEGPAYTDAAPDFPVDFAPPWAQEPSSGDPARDLERLLDRFRDDVRDTARDHGVTAEQLSEVRDHLSTAAARIAGVLRPEARDAGSAR